MSDLFFWELFYNQIQTLCQGKRIKITKASYKDGVLSILRVIPEGKKEMDFHPDLLD